MENTEILKPVKIFDVDGFERYCENRSVKKITFTSSPEEYDFLNLPDNCEDYPTSHWCMFPFSVVEAEFTEIQSDYNSLILSGKTCAVILHNVKRIELYNAYSKADMIAVHTYEEREHYNVPERVFLFGLQYE